VQNIKGVKGSAIQGDIRVLQLGSPKGLYGAERWILALSKYLDPDQVATWIAAIKDCPEDNVELCREADNLGIKNHIFEAFGYANPRSILLVKDFILVHKIDVLHCHGYKTDIIGYFATRGTQTKVITTPHGWSKTMDVKLWFYEILDRCLFPFLDAVVPLSEDLYQPLTKIPVLKNKLHFIRNGVDICEIDAVQQINPEMSCLKKNGNFILGYIGQLIYRKGLDVLLSALSQIKKIPWKMVLIGDGEQRKELESQAFDLKISENVLFMGYRNDRLALLKGFDVFVLPSRLEGIPRCLMEAMAAKVAIVASDIPGCKDLIVDEQRGLLFPIDDIHALSKAIERLASDNELRQEIVDNSRRYVVENYSAYTMAGSYLEMYKSLAISE